MKKKRKVINNETRAGEKHRLNISFAINDHFGMQLAVTLYSLLLSASSDYRYNVYILGNGICEQTKGRIKNIGSRFPKLDSITWLDACSINLDSLPKTKSAHLSPEVYLRLFLPELIPSSVDKVLYLDADIVVEADIAELYSTEMNNKTILAVRDFGFHTLATGLPLAINELEANPDSPYFNSGVMLIDLQRWRSRRYFNRALLCTQKFKDTIQWGDQDVLNAILVDDWRPIDEMWNVQVAAILNYSRWMDSDFKESLAERVDHILAPPCILHFVGPWKPWLPGFDNRLRKRYFCFLARCGWFNPAQFFIWYISCFLRRIIFI